MVSPVPLAKTLQHPAGPAASDRVEWVCCTHALVRMRRAHILRSALASARSMPPIIRNPDPPVASGGCRRRTAWIDRDRTNTHAVDPRRAAGSAADAFSAPLRPA